MVGQSVETREPIRRALKDAPVVAVDQNLPTSECRRIPAHVHEDVKSRPLGQRMSLISGFGSAWKCRPRSCRASFVSVRLHCGQRVFSPALVEFPLAISAGQEPPLVPPHSRSISQTPGNEVATNFMFKQSKLSE